MAAGGEMRSGLCAAWDQLSALSPAGERLTAAAGLVGELEAEWFDRETINDAVDAIESMQHAAAAVHKAGLDASALLAVIDEF